MSTPTAAPAALPAFDAVLGMVPVVLPLVANPVTSGPATAVTFALSHVEHVGLAPGRADIEALAGRLVEWCSWSDLDEVECPGDSAGVLDGLYVISACPVPVLAGGLCVYVMVVSENVIVMVLGPVATVPAVPSRLVDEVVFCESDDLVTFSVTVVN